MPQIMKASHRHTATFGSLHTATNSLSDGTRLPPVVESARMQKPCVKEDDPEALSQAGI